MTESNQPTMLIRQFLHIFELSGARAKVHGRLVMKNKHRYIVVGSKTKRRIHRWRNACSLDWRNSDSSLASLEGPSHTYSLFKTGIKRKRVIVSVSIINSRRFWPVIASCGNRGNVRRCFFIHSLSSLQKDSIEFHRQIELLKGFTVAV
jgi:hypothetical protein